MLAEKGLEVHFNRFILSCMITQWGWKSIENPFKFHRFGNLVDKTLIGNLYAEMLIVCGASAGSGGAGLSVFINCN